MPATPTTPPVKMSPTGVPILSPDAQPIAALPRVNMARKCAIEEREDGTAVSFFVDAQTWSRLKRKMQTQDPAEFMWQEVIRRNIEGMVY